MAEVRNFGLMSFNFKLNEISFCYSGNMTRKFITKLHAYQYVIRTDEFGWRTQCND